MSSKGSSQFSEIQLRVAVCSVQWRRKLTFWVDTVYSSHLTAFESPSLNHRYYHNLTSWGKKVVLGDIWGFLWGQQWPSSPDKNPFMSNWNGHLWTFEVAIIYHPPRTLYWVPSAYILTTIHTWAHLALANHMKAGWTNNPQVALTTLKLRAHTCPYVSVRKLPHWV